LAEAVLEDSHDAAGYGLRGQRRREDARRSLFVIEQDGDAVEDLGAALQDPVAGLG